MAFSFRWFPEDTGAMQNEGEKMQWPLIGVTIALMSLYVLIQVLLVYDGDNVIQSRIDAAAGTIAPASR